MERYLKGDIILSPFPFSGEEDFKVRPALVLAALPYAGGVDYLVCLITTQAAPDPYLLSLTNADIEGGRLSQDCYLRPTYAYAVASHQIRRRLGRLKTEKLNTAIQTLVSVLSQ